jgi:hypothetical protein
MNEANEKIRQQIASYIDCDTFIRIQERLAELRKEEEAKLNALADLQKAYNSASSDAERENVKQIVGKIREISRTARVEIRELKQQILAHMPLERATELYNQLLNSSE